MVNKSNFLVKATFATLSNWDPKFYNLQKLIFSKKYNSVKFRKITLPTNIEWVQIKDDEEYSILGVRSYGLGAYINRTVSGKTLKMRKYQKSEKGHLFWCKVDTKNGAFGVVNDELENSYGSSNMSYLKLNTKKIDTNYLQLLFQLPKFTSYMDNMVVGVTNRKYISMQVLLNNIEIPLPDISIQNKLVSQYSELIRQADEADKEATMLENEIERYLFEVLGISEYTPQEKSDNVLNFISLKQLFKWGVENNLNSMSPTELFKSIMYKNAPITNFCEINPSTIYSKEVEEMSFLPMECISDVYGEITKLRDGEKGKSKGYTRFQENDVLWAKITPCMQNGKSAIAKKLKNGYGYGSTEYHVFRAKENKVLPEFLYCFLRTKAIRELAKVYFTGSAGQQRVGTDFLEALTLPNIPIKSDDKSILTQEIIVNEIFDMKLKIKGLKTKAINLRHQAKKEFEEDIFDE